MIYTFIADFSSLDFDKAMARQESLCDCKNDFFKSEETRICLTALERIHSTGSEKMRKERLAAYLLASYATRQITGKAAEIFWKENKKPTLKDSSCRISISHTDRLVACSLSEGSDVGVDVEKEISKSRISRLDERYFTKMNFSLKPLDVSYFFFTLSSEGSLNKSKISFIPVLDTDFSFDSGLFTAKWCTYEAMVKQGTLSKSSDYLDCKISAKADIKEIVIEKEKYYISTVSN